MKSLEIDGVKIAEISDELADFLKRKAADGVGVMDDGPIRFMPFVVGNEIACSMLIVFPVSLPA